MAMSVSGLVGLAREEQQRVDGERAAERRCRWSRPIRRGFGDGVGADIAGGAGLILHREIGAGMPRLQTVREHATDDVRARAGAERHDDAHKLGRPDKGLSARALRRAASRTNSAASAR